MRSSSILTVKKPDSNSNYNYLRHSIWQHKDTVESCYHLAKYLSQRMTTISSTANNSNNTIIDEDLRNEKVFHTMARICRYAKINTNYNCVMKYLGMLVTCEYVKYVQNPERERFGKKRTRKTRDNVRGWYYCTEKGLRFVNIYEQMSRMIPEIMGIE